MTDDVKERVARAMIAADSGPIGSALYEIHEREFGEGYASSADAALSALRPGDEINGCVLVPKEEEVTEKMVAAWVKETRTPLDLDGYRAMLTAAKEEGR